MEEGYDSDSDHIDHNNYKGIYFEDDPGGKWQDPVSGAHFRYDDMIKRLEKVIYLRRSEERQRDQLLDHVEK